MPTKTIRLEVGSEVRNNLDGRLAAVIRSYPGYALLITGSGFPIEVEGDEELGNWSLSGYYYPNVEKMKADLSRENDAKEVCSQ
jgi:hypothetical protein